MSLSFCGWRRPAAAMVLTTILLVAFQARGDAPDESSSSGKSGAALGKKMAWKTVGLESNYWELYPRREDMTLMAMERLRDGLGITLHLKSDMPAFSHFLFSINGASWQKSESGLSLIHI